MLRIICGEDTTASRNYFVNLKTEFSNKNYLTKDILPQEVFDLSPQSSDNLGLFHTKTAFFTINLDKYIKKFSRSEKGKEILEKIQTFSESKDLVLVDWEDSVSLYNLKLKKTGIVKEFKPSGNIFKLLDSCYPGNLVNFLNQLNQLVETSDAQFIFIMLSRHIRALILASSNILTGLAPWQKSKLISQVGKWSKKNLLSFYEGLYKIDVSLKTGGSYRGVKESLDILSCFYLR